MLVPYFSLQQDYEAVEVRLRLPYVKISASYFHISENNFKFYLKPYLLSLEFYQKLQESYTPYKLQYNHENYVLTVRLLKLIKGEHFTKLDILPTLVIGSKSRKKPKNMQKMQIICEKSEVSFEVYSNSNMFSYGFGNNYYNIFVDLEEYAAELFDFSPYTVSQPERLSLSRKITEYAFDIESFLFDEYYNYEIHDVLAIKITPYMQFNQLLKIEPRHLLLSKHLIKPTTFQIVNICYCFNYYMLCMAGYLGPESGKTINMTSSVFSCNVDFVNFSLKDVIIYGMRRCMAYSLYKCYKVAQRALYSFRNMNKQYILNILSSLHQLYSQSDIRHFLNKIYISDYIVFLQETEDLVLETVAELKSVDVKIEDIGLGISEALRYVNEYK